MIKRVDFSRIQPRKLSYLFSKEAYKDWLALGFFGAVTVLFMWRVVFGGKVLLPLDMVFSAEPWRSEAAEHLTRQPWNSEITDAIWQFYPMGSFVKNAHQSGIPLWDPYVLGGMPGFARGEMFSNPSYNIFSLFLSPARAMSWAAVFSLLVGGFFTYKLLREFGAGLFGSLVGGLAFTFNGYLVGMLSFPNHAGTMAWLPLVFWGVERALRRKDWRWALVGSLGFALQIFSGSILWPFYGGITLVLFTIYRSLLAWLEDRNFFEAVRPIFYAGLALGLGAILAAPQILSTIQLYLNTERTEALGAHSFLNALSQPIRLLVPRIYGYPVHGNEYLGPFSYTETDLYFGILTLFFIPASLFSHERSKRRIAWGLFGIGLVAFLAVYGLFPFKQIVTILYPVFLNAFPGRIFYLVAFTWSLAAGLGADWIVEARPSRLLRIFSISALALGVGLAGLFLLARHYPLLEKVSQLSLTPIVRWLKQVHPESLLFPLGMLVIACMLFWFWSRGGPRNWIYPAVALSLVAVDVLGMNIDYNPAFEEQHAFLETPSLQHLIEQGMSTGEPYRIANINSGVILLGMTPELFQLPTIAGYSSYVMKRYSDYADLTGSRGKATVNQVYFTDCCNPLLDALNVKYVYTSSDVVPIGTGALDLASRLDQAEVDVSVNGEVHLDRWRVQGVDRRVLFEQPPARVAYHLHPRKGSVFTAWIGLDPQAWEEPGDGVQFGVYIQGYESSKQTRLFSRYLDPKNVLADRAWIPLEIDLSEYAGKDITLSLVTGIGPEGDSNSDWAGWVLPQIKNYAPQTLKLVYDGPNKIYENTLALPRAWVVHRIIQVARGDTEAVESALLEENFDPASEAVVEVAEGDLPSVGSESDSTGPAEETRVLSYSNERVVIEAKLDNPGLLVLSDTDYPGWRAYVDGAESPILTANLIMRGVFLDKGAHRVEFVFQPKTFYGGLVMAGTCLVVILVVLFLSLRHNRVSSEE